MGMMTSACGIYQCDGCEHVTRAKCPGCFVGNAHLRDAGQAPCGVFACVESRGIESCNQCNEGSCALRRTVESICPVRSRYENIRWWAGKMSRALESRGNKEPASDEGQVSSRVINRLRWYLTALDSFAAEGAASVSSWQLAERVGVNAALIRKDLSKFGEFGTPSFGYRVDYLIQRIRSILRLDEPKGIIWIGAACFRLHCGLVGRLENHSCGVVAVFDPSAEEAGTSIGGYEVLPIDRLEEVVSQSEVHAAAIAVCGPQAQSIAETLARLGIKAILNVGGELLVLPDSVRMYSFDIVGELLELCYYCGT